MMHLAQVLGISIKWVYVQIEHRKDLDALLDDVGEGSIEHKIHTKVPADRYLLLQTEELSSQYQRRYAAGP